jgi:hypothetical protein
VLIPIEWPRAEDGIQQVALIQLPGEGILAELFKGQGNEPLDANLLTDQQTMVADGHPPDGISPERMGG